MLFVLIQYSIQFVITISRLNTGGSNNNSNSFFARHLVYLTQMGSFYAHLRLQQVTCWQSVE